ncbi:hypothetical protein OGAPHI_005644 [Ogataea philodendri]|uniref:Uncharacterized protein n=1 Tax=Ogataea philodendri TaxID=1378263 RepID=A0A9P8NZJ2_9ASCO|nr:uncharacterized protein OGAPHI_005644 [Ogataea philodendri]KAH3662392.1 hypothetical protein OGAPHI_005644 [Ogataea philodendri]
MVGICGLVDFSRPEMDSDDLVKESGQNLSLEPSGLVDLGDLGTQFSGDLLLVLLVQLVDLELVEELLALGLLGCVFAAIVLVQQSSLLWGADLEGRVDHPRTLVVQNVGSNLTNVLWFSKTVEIVVLDLEVLTQWDQNVVGLLEVSIVGNTSHIHGKSHGQVERVVCSFVDDDEGVLAQGELGKVDRVLWSGDQIQQLSQLGLESHVMEQFQQVDVIGVLSEVFLEQHVQGTFEHERVVDGDLIDTFDSVPAGLTSSGDRLVHHVIGNKEVGLQQLDTPAENCSLLVLLLAEVIERLVTFQKRISVHHRQPSVEFPTRGVVVQTALEPFNGIFRHSILLGNRNEVVDQVWEDGQKLCS